MISLADAASLRLSPTSAITAADAAAVSVPPVIPAMGAICTVLILGARGRLGYACVQAFAQAGWRVLAHVRPGSTLVMHATTSQSAGVVTWVDTALEDVAAWRALLDKQGPVHVVLNALAPAFSTRAWASELGTLNQRSMHVARMTKALLLLPVSVLAYGRNLPPVLYEDDSMPAAESITTCMGVLRAESEWQLRIAAESGLQVCMVRAGAFYGHPGNGWIRDTVAKQLRDGRMAWLGPYNVPTPWVYVNDLAATLERVASQRHRLDVWTRLHFAGQQRCGSDWQQALAQTAQQRGWLSAQDELHPGKLPWWMWKPIGWISPSIRALGEMEYVWRTPHQLDNFRMLELIGNEPRTDWQRSVEQTVDLLFPEGKYAEV